MKNLYFKISLSSALFIVLLFGAELLLRTTLNNPEKTPEVKRHILLKEYRPHTADTHLLPGFSPTGDILHNETRAVRFAIDENGFIEPSNIFENPDLKIAFLGGSTTECAAVVEKKRFPYVVGQLLSRDGVKVNTINAGVAGNNSAHTINILLNKVLAEEPDIAVMMHNINDLNLLLQQGKYWTKNGASSHLVTEERSLKRALSNGVKSAFPNLDQRTRSAISRFNKKPSSRRERSGDFIEIDSLPITRLFTANLQVFISIARTRGITPVLMTQASRIKDDLNGLEFGIDIIESRYNISFKEYQKLYAKMNQTIREVCEDENVLLIDLAKTVPPRYISDAVHLTDSGSEHVAEIIAEQLFPLIPSKSE